MSILRLSTLSQGLAIAVITLGLAAAPAFSNPADPDTGCHDHKDCLGDDVPQSTFDVNLVLITPNISCLGNTTNSIRSVRFPEGTPGPCPVPVKVTDPPAEFGPGPLCPCGVELRHTKKKTEIMLFFHQPCTTLHCGAETWVSPRLPAVFNESPEGGDFSFEVVADDVLVDLTKNHEPFKGTTMLRVFTVDGIIYTVRMEE